MVLVCYAIFCSQYMRSVPVKVIVLDSLDLITIVIPPALPMAMTVGTLELPIIYSRVNNNYPRVTNNFPQSYQEFTRELPIIFQRITNNLPQR